MKFQLQAVAALALVAGSAAFCPAPVTASRPAFDLAMVANNNNDNDLGKAAMSFMVASVLAVSTSTTILPVPAAIAAPKAAVVAEKVKVDLKTLAPEDRNLVIAKKNCELSQESLKEYTKYVSEAKMAESKAVNAFQTQERVVATSKKLLISDSDKLSAAKNQKMPTTAITELTSISTVSKNALKVEEKKLSALDKVQSQAASKLKSAENGVQESKNAIKQGEKKLKKAEKDYQKYQKKVQQQKKKDAESEKKAKAVAQKAVQEQEKKLKALEAETRKLESLKENSEKEIQNKQKLIEAEKKSLEKMKGGK